MINKIPKSQKVESWGMNHFSNSPVFYPQSERELTEIFTFIRDRKMKLSFKGSGCSYGDAFTNQKGVIVDLSKFNKIIGFDEKNYVLTAQSGSTLKQVWQYSIEKGFWPPVVSGTMYTSLGGILSMNIHGKNNFAVGTIGEHVVGFSFMTIDGKIHVCSPEKNHDLFYSAISGFGMLGCFLNISIKMKQIYSGKMKVTAVVTKNFNEMFEYFERNYTTADYLVGWVDAFAKGSNLGRGVIHKANHFKIGEDDDFPNNCKLSKQNLPSRLFGIIPKSLMWIFMYPFSNSLGMRFINYLKYFVSTFKNNKIHIQGHAEYAFLLDYVPNWKYIYKPGGLIQYQCFIPKDSAKEAFEEIFSLCHKKNIINWLSVFKKHRPDSFLLTHGLDGYSMAMDFPLNKSQKSQLWNLAEEMDKIVLKHKGKFYFAKDVTLRKVCIEGFLSKEKLDKFRKLKKMYDPESNIESDLYRRLFC